MTHLGKKTDSAKDNLITKTLTHRLVLALLLCIIQVAGIDMYAQSTKVKTDSITNIPKARLHRIKSNIGIDKQDSLIADSLALINEDNYKKLEAPVDTAKFASKNDSIVTPPKEIFVPNSTRSVWLATIFPGAGQIYNRKYWKLPIIYGGFVGCAYALNWNNKMYKDYSQGYLDIMDNDPTTNSYLDFLPAGYDISGQEDRFKKLFKSKKDFYRRNRDLSIFCFIGVYLISIIDAYVDAELSNFDISKDLGFRIEPAVINDRRLGNSLGLQCSIKF